MPSFLSSSTSGPGSPVPANIALFQAASAGGSGGSPSPLGDFANYTGAALSPPTGKTVLRPNVTITATNGNEPTLAAGPVFVTGGYISAVNGGRTWGPSGKHGLPIKSIASGVWKINSNIRINSLCTGAVMRAGFRAWQVSADLSTVALIDLSNGSNANGWWYSGTFTPSASDQGFTMISPTLAAVTFGASTPYLYIETLLDVVTGGGNLTAQVCGVIGTNIFTMPAVTFGPTTTETSTGPIRIADASANGNDGTPVGITALATVASPFSGFGNAITFEGVNRLNDDTQGISFGPQVGLPTGSFTLDVLFKASPQGSVQPIISKRANANTAGNQFNLFLNNSNQIQCNIDNNAGTLIGLTGTTTVATADLCKVALDYDGTTIRLWMSRNGGAAVLESSTAFAGVLADNGTIRFLVGRNDEAEGAFSCSHTIDEIRISNVSRYGASYTAPTAPFTSDANTLLLAHLDTLVANSSPADTPTRSFTGARTQTETVTASDSVARAVAAIRSITETVGPAADTVGRGGTTVRAATLFTGSTTDTVTTAQVLARIVTETQTTSDVPTRILAASRLVTAAVSASDAVARAQTLTRVPTETDTTSDTPSRNLGQGRNPAETVTAAATVTRLLTATRGPSETVTTSDVVTRTAQFNRALSETVTSSDVVSRVQALGRNPSESDTTVDTVARSYTAGRIVTETLNGNTPDWPLNPPVKHIAGVVRDEDTNAAVGTGYTVQLIRTSDNVMVASTTTDASGNYSFARGTDDPYTYVVYAFNGAPTQMHGTTDRGLVPA